jgi:eukaryotic-like serine/threonine-protein kinase
LPGKQVAIKVLHVNGKPLSSDALARFRREAEVATRINHPNIVEVHDFNTLPDGAPYLVLEFLQGESLASRLRHPMEVDEVQRILRQVGSALQAAHAHGVVHRDLKPDNIFIVSEPMGEVIKVLDFGISKVVDSMTLQTQEAVLVGTPAYMSPEQALGNNKDVGPQSDVFALGAIAYEMLTGAPPFGGESIAQLVFKIAYEPHRPLSAVKEGLSANVVRAVERALLKDRAQRYPDVAAFIEELTGARLPEPRRAEGSNQASGVATPGSGSSDSVMMGKTAAPTPAPVRELTPVAAVSAPPARQGPVKQIALAVAVVAGLAIAYFAATSAPRVGVAIPVPTVQPLSVPVEAIDAAVAFVPQEAVDAGGVEVRAPLAVPSPGRRFAMPSQDELEKVAELERLVADKRFKDATEISDRINRLTLSAVGMSYAAMLGTQANCGYKDQAGAQTRFRNITEPSHRTQAKGFCAKYIDVSLLSH